MPYGGRLLILIRHAADCKSKDKKDPQLILRSGIMRIQITEKSCRSEQRSCTGDPKVIPFGCLRVNECTERQLFFSSDCKRSLQEGITQTASALSGLQNVCFNVFQGGALTICSHQCTEDRPAAAGQFPDGAAVPAKSRWKTGIRRPARMIPAIPWIIFSGMPAAERAAAAARPLPLRCSRKRSYRK